MRIGGGLNMSDEPESKKKGLIESGSLLLKDIEEPTSEADLKDVKEKLIERLKFEMLLSELSATFINLPANKIDEEIEKSLQRIVEFLAFDRGTLNLVSADDKFLQATHSWAVEDVRPSPNVISDDYFPWVINYLKIHKKPFKFSNIDEIPSAASKDKASFQSVGVKSNLTIPLFVGGVFLGAAAFAAVRGERPISEALVQRARLAGEIFSNALIRKRTEESLQKALAEIRVLRDQLEAERNYLREEIKLQHNFDQVIGESDALKHVLFKVEQVAITNSTVLLLGETGTGKELLARSIHGMSPRKDRSFIKVDCATLPSNLIESELFGHEKGAFTGAYVKKMGKFELANKGTIFLDEIGELPIELQTKLLRVIQDREFERIGGSKVVKVDIRIIAATNRLLQEEVKKGTFREDLWYRLSVFPITVPPLRERKEDIPLLVYRLVKKFNKKLGKKVEKIPEAALETMCKYSWPGNIRELENVVERAMITSLGTTFNLTELNDSRNEEIFNATYQKTLAEVEREYIGRILQDVYWKIQGKNSAAETLGLKPSTLRDKMKKLGIKRPKLSSAS